MQYGYFDDAAREYVITDPQTPVKWINYLGTLEFGGFVDHTGGALICRGDPALNRITKYIAQLPAADFRGETLYLRLKRDGATQLLSPFFTPGLTPLDLYRCHIGLGYTKIVSEACGIRCEVTIFVPPGEPGEVRRITVTNLGPAAVEVDAIPVVEYTHPDALKQLTNADWVPQTMQSRAVWEADGRLILIQYPFMLRDLQINYFTANCPVSSFETDRRAFLGNNEYSSWAAPLSLRQPELSNGEALRGDTIAALMCHLGELAPGQSATVITLLGQAATVDAARPLIEKYRQPAAVEAALGELAHYWARVLSSLQVSTPNADLDRMVNVYNPRQCQTTQHWSRYLSLYQLGYGARGIGFRDSSQDVMGVLASLPDEAKALIRTLLQVQRPDGSAMHQFNPLTMEATMGDAHERPERPQYYSDDPLWIVLAVGAYLKETGDLAFLDETIPYYAQNGQAAAPEQGSVWDHLRRAVAFTRGDVGGHGLPRLGFADWNDTINLAAGAESLLTACLYGRALRELIELAEHLGDAMTAASYAADHAEMAARVNASAWDGAWYISYFDADGAPLGSHRNDHGQIYITGQPWPVMAGFAPPERARQALDSVYTRLNTPRGIKLSVPAFNGFDPGRGGITTYPPGAKENGGIFLHTNPWVIIAEALTGQGDRAFRYYDQINPAARNDEIERYECEPYVYPQNILGDEHPQFGLARNSWLSGTASWMYQAASQSILGIQPSHRGLRMAPCIPPAWDGFRARREFRGAVYDIAVENPEHVASGVKALWVDGEPALGDTLPIFAGGTHRVRVVMGA